MKDIHQDQRPPKPGLQSSLAQRTYINPLSLLLVRLWSQPIWSPSLVNAPGPRRSSEDPGSPLFHEGLAELPGPFQWLLPALSFKGGASPGPREPCSWHKREERIKETHINTLHTKIPPKHPLLSPPPYSNQGVSWRFLFHLWRCWQGKSGSSSCTSHKIGVVDWGEERPSLG